VVAAPLRPAIPKLAKISSCCTQKMGLLIAQRKIRGTKMEFSKSIFSYCDYVVILDVEVHRYHMDIQVVSQGIAGY
jgi:hypothetical protein